MKITPPGDKLLVEIIVEETTTKGGIILVQENHKDGQIDPHSIHQAVVKHVGRECKFVKKGDAILLEHCYVRPFVFKGMLFKIISEKDIVGVTR